MKVASSSRNLWISGLSSSTIATDLKTVFSKYGKVIGAKVVTNARTPGARCYGYVTMSTNEDASKCIQHLNRTELHGRMITVEKAKAEAGPPKPGSSSGDKKEDKKKEAETTKKDDKTEAPKKDTAKEGEKKDGHVRKSQGHESRSRERGRSHHTQRSHGHSNSSGQTAQRGVLTFSQIRDQRKREVEREEERRRRDRERRRAEEEETRQREEK